MEDVQIRCRMNENSQDHISQRWVTRNHRDRVIIKLSSSIFMDQQKLFVDAVYQWDRVIGKNEFQRGFGKDAKAFWIENRAPYTFAASGIHKSLYTPCAAGSYTDQMEIAQFVNKRLLYEMTPIGADEVKRIRDRNSFWTKTIVINTEKDLSQAIGRTYRKRAFNASFNEWTSKDVMDQRKEERQRKQNERQNIYFKKM